MDIGSNHVGPEILFSLRKFRQLKVLNATHWSAQRCFHRRWLDHLFMSGTIVDRKSYWKPENAYRLLSFRLAFAGIAASIEPRIILTMRTLDRLDWPIRVAPSFDVKLIIRSKNENDRFVGWQYITKYYSNNKSWIPRRLLNYSIVSGRKHYCSSRRRPFRGQRYG
jgi:hypothetical protein